MSSYLSALETQWLTTHFPHLLRLVDTADIGFSRRECGFEQALQRKLRNFDFDPGLIRDMGRNNVHDATTTTPVVTAPPLRGNVRGKLAEVRRICRTLEEGGLQYERAFRALEVLEEVEVHRQRLVRATRAELGRISGHERDHSAQVVEQLHVQATEHYKACQLGFRAMCLMKILPPSPVSQHDAAKVMARLNALFPPDFADCATTRAKDSFVELHDLMPCTTGLRDSIRFCVYGNLMSDSGDNDENGQVEDSQPFQDKFTVRCSIPTYQEARHKLGRYIGEANKMEMTCLGILHAIKFRSSPALMLDCTRPSTPSSFIVHPDRSRSPEPIPATPGSSSSIKLCQAALSDTSTVADMSITSIRSSAHTSVRSIPSTTLSPLLKGMPGRELSPAKTDGAAFAMDFSAPDVLVYPRDLSQTEFHVHPLAMSSGEDDSGEDGPVPIVAIRQRAVRTKSKLSKRKRVDKQSDGLLQQALSLPSPQALPPLPLIPEAFKSATTPNLLGKLLERIRKESESLVTTNAATASTRDLHFSKRSSDASASSAARSSKRGKKKVSSLKSQISDPTLNQAGSFSLGIPFHQGPGPKFENSPSTESISSPSLVTDWAAAPRHQEQGCVDTSFHFTLAPPRLSPMEYARIYMLHQVETQRSGQKCLLPAPQKQWFWTPKWEQFLIVPRIPRIIKRCDSSKDGGCCDEADDSRVQLPRSPDSAASLDPVQPMTGCPRLSLHLGGMTTLMPSVMNLTSLGMSGAVDSHDLACSVPRWKSRRQSTGSDSKRTSLTTLTENETWTPSSWDDAPSFLSHGKRQSTIHDLSHTSLIARHGFSTYLGPRAYQDLSATRSNPSSFNDPASQALSYSSASLYPLPLFSGTQSSHNIAHMVSSDVECKSLRVHDGLTTGRIQSVTASFMDDGDTESEGSHSTVACEHSPDILCTCHRGSAIDDDKGQRQRAVVTHLKSRSQPCSPRLNDSRRHSLHVRAPVSSHVRHGSLDSVLSQATYCQTSPSSSSTYVFEDTFLESHHDMMSLSSSQQHHPQTPQTPVPDSPTLGQEEVIVNNEPAHPTANACTKQISPPPLPSNLTRTSKRRGSTALHGYGCSSSSFALNRAKSHEAFTLLPRLSATRYCDARTASKEDPVLHPARGVENMVRARAVSDRTTALALRDHDTASRLASAVASNDDVHLADANGPFVVPDKHKPSAGQTKTTFGSLFAKHGRRRSCSKPLILSEDDSVRTVVQSTEKSQRSCSGPGSLVNASLSPQRQGEESHASNTTSSLAGLKEKLKLRKGYARPAYRER
ncbi:hypothetical protein E4U55_003657 [Claviceps digitariae]|nr:hypothetical protein E4U55_003657 [Claviceps digitariae]